MLVALKLLVVDDDGPTLKLMHKVLTSLKAEVRALRDGEQALTLVNLLQGDDIRVGHPRIELQVVVVGIEDDWHGSWIVEVTAFGVVVRMEQVFMHSPLGVRPRIAF